MHSTKLLLFFLLWSSICLAQDYTLSGYVKDANTGETLIGTNIYNQANRSQGAVSNNYGFYSLTLPKGKYIIVWSSVGYKNVERELILDRDQNLNLELSEGVVMQEVVISGKPKDNHVQSTEMGTVTLPIENIKKMPALMGEADILKALQLLPGVMAAGEGSSGFYVRGGGPDQNLVLLDEAPVYNPGHMLGFFSVFNADAVKNTTLIKGGMPANYGGRLSSVVDIQMKEGNNKNYAMEGGIGLISSRFTAEGPIQKNKSSFMVSARRTYILDLVQPYVNQTKFAGTNYYFYDLNTKVNYTFSDKDRVYLSGYFGRDILVFNSKESGFKINIPYGNATATLRWNHVFNQKLFMNVTGVYNDYDFTVQGGQETFQLKVANGVRDWNGKIDFEAFPNYKHNLKFGLNYIRHRMSPNIATFSNESGSFTNDLKPKYADEAAIYINNDHKVTKDLSLSYGLRGSWFAHVGPYKSPQTGKIYGDGEVVKGYPRLDPRLTGKYSLSATSSLKFGVTLTHQFVHLVSNSTSTLPTDIWVPSSAVVKPQRGIQYALGYFRNFEDNKYETSIEIYYKDLWNQIDYPENYVQSPTTDIENEFVYGKGRAYGAEFFLKKAKGRLNGWIGYTLARSERRFPDINKGAVYPAVYDRTHDIVLVANYRLSRKWDFNTNFVYATGNNYTPLQNLFLINQQLNIEYGNRNSRRYQAYHRLDAGFTYSKNPDSKKKFTSTWSFGVYNAYNQFNPFFIYYNIQTDVNASAAKATAFQVTLFPIIPSVTWNFKWQQKPKSSIEY
jgi:hypothetical protein